MGGIGGGCWTRRLRRAPSWSATPASCAPPHEPNRERMSEQPARASHDSGVPENLLRFMTTGWALPPATSAAPIDGSAAFAARRAALLCAFPGATLIVLTGHEH